MCIKLHRILKLEQGEVVLECESVVLPVDDDPLDVLLRARLVSKSPEMSNSPKTATSEARKPGWQCAAVITYCRLINTPPHLFLVKRPSHVDSRTSTCQGNSPKLAPLPPTMRPVFINGLRPHSEIH